MSSRGYVYALINASMPGLVKVGRTTGEPRERSIELSKATGVATPFVVVFEQYFNDCNQAEQFVHSYLSSKGFRVAENREFFVAPSTEVVKAIMAAPAPIEREGALAQESQEVDSEDIVDEFDDGMPAHLLVEPNHVWDSLLKHAIDCYEGNGDEIEDHREAAKLFLQAAKLGSPGAFMYLGELYSNDESPLFNRLKAVNFLKQGAKQGNHLCYAQLGWLFHLDRQDFNADKCWGLFFEKLRSVGVGTREGPQRAIDMLAIYVQQKKRALKQSPHLDVLAIYGDELLANLTASRDFYAQYCENTGMNNFYDEWIVCLEDALPPKPRHSESSAAPTLGVAKSDKRGLLKKFWARPRT